jgi:hypothetical protein
MGLGSSGYLVLYGENPRPPAESPLEVGVVLHHEVPELDELIAVGVLGMELLSLFAEEVGVGDAGKHDVGVKSRPSRKYKIECNVQLNPNFT